MEQAHKEQNKFYLEEHFYAVDEEKYDNDEHQDGVTTIKDVSVEMQVFLAKPNEEELSDQQGITDDIEGDKTKE